jgi:hypothetical protein
MSAQRQDLINLEDSISDEIKRQKSEFKDNVKRNEKALLKDYQAQVEAGLIDPDKIKKYAELLGRDIKSDRKEPPPRDKKIQKANLRRAQEKMLADETEAWFSPSTPCQPNAAIDGVSWSSTWESSDPMFSGGTNASDKVSTAQKQLNFELLAWEGYVFAPLYAQAHGGGYLRFKIPGSVIPYGKIQMTPYVNIQGMARVAGWLSSNFHPGCEAWASIQIQTRMTQAVTGWQYPGVKTVTDWTKPHILWEEKSPPVNSMSGWQNIAVTKFADQAKAVGVVDAGLDVYVDVMVKLFCNTLGWGIAAFYFDGASEFIRIEKVCMKVLQTYMYTMELPPWYWKLHLPTIPTERLKDLKKVE